MNRRTLAYVLLTIVLAGWLGQMIARDSGYVLIRYGDSMLQTSIWVMLGILLLLWLALYALLKVIHFVRASPGSLGRWQQARRSSRANRDSGRGVSNLLEDNWMRAERYLSAAATDSALPVANWLGSALAAHRQGRSSERDDYLAKAAEAEPDAATGIGLLKARLQFESGDLTGCEQTIRTLPRELPVVLLERDLWLRCGDTERLENLIPELRSVGASDTDELEVQILEDRLTALISSADAEPHVAQQRGKSIYQRASKRARNANSSIIAYCRLLIRTGESAEARKLLEKLLGREWNADAAECYTDMADAEGVVEQLKTVGKWLKNHPTEPGLQLCAADLYRVALQLDKSREHLERALDLPGDHHRHCYAELGRICRAQGDFVKSSNYFQKAYSA